jgi:DNA-binding PadR family transcriptional regulator
MGGRQRRMFDGGELRLVLLKLIADETRHGYELIRAIEEMTGGAYAPSPGVVYPTLSMLDEMGLIDEQRSDDAKKRFAVTDAGRALLAERAEEVAALMARLEELGARRQRHSGAPVGRAMGNLAAALQHRLARGDFSDDTLHDIAAMLDEVAQRIERLR